MPNEKSVEEITIKIRSKIEQLLNQEIPIPGCAEKKPHAEWKRDQVRKKLYNSDAIGPTVLK